MTVRITKDQKISSVPTPQRREVLPFKKRYITPEEVEELYSLGQRLLAGWRRKNIGPPFRRFGHKTVLYNVLLLEQWIERQEGGGGDAI